MQQSIRDIEDDDPAWVGPLRECSGGVWAEINDEHHAPSLDYGSTDPTEAHEAAWGWRKRHAERRPLKTSKLLIEVDRWLSSPVSSARSTMTLRIDS
jgi:hypothetical protein